MTCRAGGRPPKPEAELYSVRIMVSMTEADRTLLTRYVGGRGLSTLLREAAKREARGLAGALVGDATPERYGAPRTRQR